jgi:hypothetical protein
MAQHTPRRNGLPLPSTPQPRMSAQPTHGQVFLQRLDALQRDAAAAARYAYAGSSINFMANQNLALVPLLDRDASFWNTVLGAMQTASIVALGRIYDSRKDVLSADRLVKHQSRNNSL